MNNQEQILLRQFLLFFVLPIFIIIVGSVIAVNIFSDRQTAVLTNNIQVDPLSTNGNDYLAGAEENLITIDQKDADKVEGLPPSKTAPSSTPKPKQNNKIAYGNNILFYAGLVICSGILVVVIGGGVFFILMPTKNKK